MNRTVRMLLSCILIMGLCSSLAMAAGKDYPKATKRIKTLFKEDKIISIKQSPIKGLLEVVMKGVNDKGEPSYRAVYINKEGRLLMFQGHMLDVTGEQPRSLTNEVIGYLQYSSLITDGKDKLNVKALPLDGSIVMGNPKAKIQVAVFDDPF